MDIASLQPLLSDRFDSLRGVWVAFPRNYETACAEALGGVCVPSRYWDCEVENVKIELKKTRKGNMWFDLVRYSESVVDPARAAGVVTLVMRYELLPIPAVTQLAVISHHQLLAVLQLSPEKAKAVMRLNAQANLTWTDMAAAADFVLTRGTPS